MAKGVRTYVKRQQVTAKRVERLHASLDRKE